MENNILSIYLNEFNLTQKEIEYMKVTSKFRNEIGFLIGTFDWKYSNGLSKADDKWEAMFSIIEDNIENIRELAIENSELDVDEINQVMNDELSFEEFLTPLYNGYSNIVAGKTADDVISEIKKYTSSKVVGGGMGIVGSLVGMTSAAIFNTVKDSGFKLIRDVKNEMRFKKNLANFFENTNTVLYIKRVLINYYIAVWQACVDDYESTDIRWIQSSEEEDEKILNDAIRRLNELRIRNVKEIALLFNLMPHSFKLYENLINGAMQEKNDKLAGEELSDILIVADFFGESKKLYWNLLKILSKERNDNYALLNTKYNVLKAMFDAFKDSVSNKECVEDFCLEFCMTEGSLKDLLEKMDMTESPGELVKGAVSLIHEKKARYAIEKLNKAAEMGSYEACYWLGYCYHLAWDTKKDFDLAIKYYLKSAEVMPESYMNIGRIYLENVENAPDEKKALEYFVKAREGGVIESNVYISDLYIMNAKWHDAYRCLGLLTESVDKEIQEHKLLNLAKIFSNQNFDGKGLNESISILEKLCEDNNDDAAKLYGEICISNKLSTETIEKAIKCVQKAIINDRNKKGSNFKLLDGELYYIKGTLISKLPKEKRDIDDIIYYYQFAKKQGVARANIPYAEYIMVKDTEKGKKELLSLVNSENKPEIYFTIGQTMYFKKLYKEALEYLLKADELGYYGAEEYIGYIYWNGGNGVSKNEELAKKFYLKGSQQGNSRCMHALSNLYYFAKKIPRNPEQCIYWANEAIKHNNSCSYYLLGLCYENGFGVQKDYSRALENYEKAKESELRKIAVERIDVVKIFQRNEAYKKQKSQDSAKERKEQGEMLKTQKNKDRCVTQNKVTPKTNKEKNKYVAAILAILLGNFGIHKFYMGKTLIGIVYIVFSWTCIPAIIGFFQGITYLFIKEEKFKAKCMKKREKNTQKTIVSTNSEDGKTCNRCGKKLNAIGKCNFCDYN